MRKFLISLLFVFGCTFACSPYFSSDFCQEIDYWNTRPIKYKYVEIEPNWLMIFQGYHSFNFILRF